LGCGLRATATIFLVGCSGPAGAVFDFVGIDFGRGLVDARAAPFGLRGHLFSSHFFFAKTAALATFGGFGFSCCFSFAGGLLFFGAALLAGCATGLFFGEEPGFFFLASGLFASLSSQFFFFALCAPFSCLSGFHLVIVGRSLARGSLSTPSSFAGFRILGLRFTSSGASCVSVESLGIGISPNGWTAAFVASETSLIAFWLR
jgi:hypothetical protein